MKINAGQAPSTLIPEYIGSDFDKVITVADNMETVTEVVTNLDHIKTVESKLGDITTVADDIADVVTVSDNIDYVKDVAEGIEGLPVTSYIGDAPPTQPLNGAEWYCTTDGRTYVWYADADSSQWVESSPQSTMETDPATAITNTDNIFALWKRSAAEAGLNLVAGSFEEGGVLTSSSDVLLHKESKSIYAWSGLFPHTVGAGTNPTLSGSGYVPRTDVTLRSEINIVTKKFNNVAQMVSDTSLYIGQSVEWLGYSNIFDGGGNVGIVVPHGTGISDGGSFFDCASGVQIKAYFSNDEINVRQFGAVSEGGSIDVMPNIKAAVAAGENKTVIIDGDFWVSFSAYTETAEIPMGCTIDFRDSARIRYDSWGLPIFWAVNKSNIKINNSSFLWYGTTPLMTGSANGAFVDMLYSSGSGRSYPQRDAAATILITGCDNVKIINPYFDSVDRDTLLSLLYKPLSISYTTRCTIGSPIFRASQWGCVAWGVDYFDFISPRGFVTGQLDTTVYTWEAPNHMLYVTPLARNSYVTVTDVIDEGVEVSGSYIAGSGSIKVNNTRKAFIDGIYSNRNQGALDCSIERGTIFNVHSICTDVTRAVTARLIRITDSSVTESNLTVDNISVDITGNDALNFPPIEFAPENGISKSTVRAKIVTDASTATGPFFLYKGNDNVINLEFIAPLFPKGTNVIVGRVDNGNYNSVELRIDSPAYDTTRFIEQTKSNYGNRFKFTDTRSGSVKDASEYASMRMMYVQARLPASGSSVTASSLIPKGAVLMGLTCTISASLGTTNGTTGFTVGDGSDVDRWGDKTGVAAGTGSGNADWTVFGASMMSAAQSVVITAKNGNFDGVGEFLVRACYFLAANEGDIY